MEASIEGKCEWRVINFTPRAKLLGLGTWPNFVAPQLF